MNAATHGDGRPDLSAKLNYLQSCVGEPVQTIETHMSWVVLGPERVLKLKKPVRYPFLDYSTLAAREANAREELRLNRRLAPAVYLGVLALLWDGQAFSVAEAPALPAAGRTVDWLVSMRRIPDDRMLDRMLDAGRAGPWDIDALAAVLGSFYSHAPHVEISAEEYLTRFRHERALDRAVLQHPGFDLPGAAATLDRLDAALSAHETELGERASRHKLLEGHGDLRPEHVCLLDPPVVIDSLEFNAAMRQVDPFDELGFLGLECEMAGAPWVGPRLIAHCAKVLGDLPPAALLHLYVAQRALLRARLGLAHLLEPQPRQPGKWLPLARRYVTRAATALDSMAPATPHGSP